MRKHFYLLAVLLTAACSENLTPIEEEAAPRKVTLEVVMEEEETRVFLDSDNYLCWKDGDQVAVNGKTYTVSVQGGDIRIPDVEEAPDNVYFAVYPAENCMADTDNGYNGVKFRMPSEYIYQETSDGKQVVQAPILGMADAREACRLYSYNSEAFIKFTLNNSFENPVLLKSVNVSAVGDNKYLSGESSVISELELAFNLVWSKASPEITGTAGTENKGVTMTFSGGRSIAAGQSFTFLIPVATFSDTPLRVVCNYTNADGSTAYKIDRTTTKSLSLARNESGPIALSTSSAGGKATGFESGTGSASNPYHISTLAQLKYLIQETAKDDIDYDSSFFVLDNDIDCLGETLYPISAYDHYFATDGFGGTFDGNGHKIYNYVQGKYDTNNSDYADNSNCVGFFAILKSNATIRNLSLNPNQFSFSGLSEKAFFGGFAGKVNGSYVVFENCSFNCSNTISIQTSGTIYWGGLAGSVPGHVSRVSLCRSDATVNLTSSSDEIYAGGLVGLIDGEDKVTFFSCCKNSGPISAQAQDNDDVAVGGILGTDKDNVYAEALVSILNCVNSGDLSARSNGGNAYCGGMLGYHNSDGSLFDLDNDPRVYNCLNKGSVTSNTSDDDSYAGGMIGWCYDNDTRISIFVNVGTLTSNKGHSGAASGNGKGTVSYGFDSEVNPVDMNELLDSGVLDPVNIGSEIQLVNSWARWTNYGSGLDQDHDPGVMAY